MKTTAATSAALLATLAAAAPTPTINKRATMSDCAQYGSTTASPYVVINDLWGESNGSGSQCYTVDEVSSGSLSWGTTWSWSNNANDVKSYANAILDFTATKLSDISSLQSSWDWSYTGDSIVADVSYDLFTNSVASTTNEEYEIMIWLGRYGTAGPIASSYDASGNPVSDASTTVAGHTFNLYSGSNGVQTKTYSFVATENITSFSGDVNDFLTYLVNNEGFDDTQYLVSIGAGTEAFTGSNAVFKTSAYSISISTGSDSSSDSSASAASSAAASSSYVAPTSSSAAVSSAASPSTYAAAASTSVAETSVAAALTSAAAAPSSYVAPSAGFTTAIATSGAALPTGGFAQPTGAHHHGHSGRPHSTGTPGDDCDVQYVYV